MIALRAAQRRRVLVESNFPSVLDEIHRSGAIDLLCFTGDIADWGLPEEYALATARIDDILKRCRLGRAQLFVVPGNHDITRSQGHEAWVEMRKLGSINETGLSDWLGGAAPPYGANPEWRDALMSRTSAFWRWVGDGLGRPGLLPANNPHRRLGFRAALDISGLPFRVHIVGLDSAWLCGDDNDARKIRVSDGQIDRLTRHDGRPLSGFRLALMHHPLADLADEKTAMRLLSETTDLVLHGHQHDPIAELIQDPDRGVQIIAAGSLYEGDRGEKWINSFHVIDVTLDADGRPTEYVVTFWAWSDRGHWSRSGAMYRAARDGVLRIAVQRRASRPLDQPARLPAADPASMALERHVFIGDAGCDQIGPGRAAITWVVIDDLAQVRRGLVAALEDWVHHRAISLDAKRRVQKSGFSLPDDDPQSRERMIDALTVAEIRGYVAVGARRTGERPVELRARLLAGLLPDRLNKRGQEIAEVHVRASFDHKGLAIALERTGRAVQGARRKAPAIRIEQPGPDSPLSPADYLAAIVARRFDGPKNGDPLDRAFDRVRAKVPYIWDADAGVAYHRRNPLP